MPSSIITVSSEECPKNTSLAKEVTGRLLYTAGMTILVAFFEFIPVTT